MDRSVEARRRAQRRYARTPKGRAAAARRRLVWYEQKQVRLSPELRELRRAYWRAKKRCQRQGMESSRSSLVQWLWMTLVEVSVGEIRDDWVQKRLRKARRIAKELDADPMLC